MIETEAKGKWYTNKWVIGGISIIVIGLIFVLTDIDEKLFAQENLLNIVIFLLLIAAALIIMRPSLILRPDPIEVLAKMCRTNAFSHKGYHYEIIEKSSLFWESGNNCYLYNFSVPSMNIKVWALGQYFPNVVVLDLVEKEIAPAEKKKKLGMEYSIEEIKNILEKQRQATELAEALEI